MADKVSPGQMVPRSAALWNNLIGAANEYAARQLGEAATQQSSGITTDIIKIKNSSGGQIRRGEVLEISGFLLTNVVREALWFDGDTPDTTRPFAVALQDIPSGSIDRAQISGACVALVNVTDADHGYAAVADTELVLQSGDGGLRILHKPTGTGELMCAILLSSLGEEKKRLCRFTLDDDLTTSDASQDATIITQYGQGVEHTATAITVYNLETSSAGVYLFAGDSGDAGLAYYDEDDHWIILQ
jgi:hypothetical protein